LFAVFSIELQRRANFRSEPRIAANAAAESLLGLTRHKRIAAPIAALEFGHERSTIFHCGIMVTQPLREVK
jgi:hypothetical protein